jgi:hypothetical protein
MRVRRRGGQLLGLGSDDIDIALDDHTGAQFVDAVNSVLGAQGEAASSVGIIRRNPDQSKVPHIDRERERERLRRTCMCVAVPGHAGSGECKCAQAGRGVGAAGAAFGDSDNETV